ncbi:MAG: DNA recombination protein RmuC [Fimbriimonas sp.]|nr:DNA recombination protein RmuC [Fimbriimonas sp.]
MLEGSIAVIGVIVGAVLCFLLMRSAGGRDAALLRDRDEQIKRNQAEIEQLRTVATQQATQISAMEARSQEREQSFEAQKLAILDAERMLADSFANLSQKALANSSEQFLQLAQQNFEKHTEGASGELKRRQQAIEELVKPLKDSLEKLDRQTQDIEQKRLAAYEGVTEHINRLMVETSQLSSALRKPHVRGSWGELTLKKAAESAGLTEGQDFDMQVSTDTDDGRLRPDMVVRLPNDGIIVVDSKVPLDSYLDAMEASDDATRTARLKAHALQVRKHVQQLSSKAYWNQFDRSPDFVVMFVPAESLYQAAIEQDLDLLETAFRSRVVLANPMTLVALLRTVAYSMNQQRVQENAEEIRATGEKLYDAVRVFSGHVGGIGKSLDQATKAYNKAVGSMERNVLSKARQLRAFGAGTGDEVEPPDEVETAPRTLQTFGSPALPEPEIDTSPSLPEPM